MSDEKKSWLDRAGAVHLWKTIEAMLGTKVDKIEGFGLSSNDYTTEEKKKFCQYVKSGEIGLSGNFLNLCELIDWDVLDYHMEAALSLIHISEPTRH